MWCQNLTSNQGPGNILGTLGFSCWVIQTSGRRQACSPGLRRPWVGPAKCTPTACSASSHAHPRQEPEESKGSHPLPAGSPANAWQGWGRLVRNHWKRSNLGGICFIIQLLLPNLSFAQGSDRFQLTHAQPWQGRARVKKCVWCWGLGTPHFGEPQLARELGMKRPEGMCCWVLQRKLWASWGEEMQPDPYLSDVCWELTLLPREGTPIADILRDLHRQAIARVSRSY